jgi:putative phosphoesterase
MLLGVISDTHDKLASIDAALQFFVEHKVDMVIHCGDWKSVSTLVYFAEQAARQKLPVRGVLGNNDATVSEFITSSLQAPGDFQVVVGSMNLDVDGKKVTIYHGHHAPTLRKLRTQEDIDILLLGHTHKPLIENVNEKLIVNPGSTAFAIPRSKLWKASVVLIDTVLMKSEIKHIDQ